MPLPLPLSQTSPFSHNNALHPSLSPFSHHHAIPLSPCHSPIPMTITIIMPLPHLHITCLFSSLSTPFPRSSPDPRLSLLPQVSFDFLEGDAEYVYFGLTMFFIYLPSLIKTIETCCETLMVNYMLHLFRPLPPLENMTPQQQGECIPLVWISTADIDTLHCQTDTCRYRHSGPSCSTLVSRISCDYVILSITTEIIL